jgi:hypothetical protein
MPLSSVELYEQLKPQLGEEGTKALIEYGDGKIRGEVATKEDLLLLKADLEKQIQGVRTDLEKQIQGLRADLEKRIQDVKMLVILVLIVVIILNPKVVELVGRILGVVK